MRTTRRALLGAAACIGLSGCLGSQAEGNETTQSPGTAGETRSPGDGTEASPEEDDGEDDRSEHDDHDDGHGDHDGHGSHDHDVDAPEEPVRSADVAAVSDEGHHFEPHLVWIEAGGTVTWPVESGVHTTTAYHPDSDRPGRIPEGADGWDSGILSEGETFERTFDGEGVYDYFCAPHEGVGMVGTVLVGDPDPHEQPGLEAPQDDLPDDARAVLERLNDAANAALGHTHD